MYLVRLSCVVVQLPLAIPTNSLMCPSARLRRSPIHPAGLFGGMSATLAMPVAMVVNAVSTCDASVFRPDIDATPRSLFSPGLAGVNLLSLRLITIPEPPSDPDRSEVAWATWRASWVSASWILVERLFATRLESDLTADAARAPQVTLWQCAA